MVKVKTENFPELQRRVTQVNDELSQLLQDAWKNGFRIRISSDEMSLVLTPKTCKKKQTVNIEKRKR